MGFLHPHRALSLRYKWASCYSAYDIGFSWWFWCGKLNYITPKYTLFHHHHHHHRHHCCFLPCHIAKIKVSPPRSRYFIAIQRHSPAARCPVRRSPSLLRNEFLRAASGEWAQIALNYSQQAQLLIQSRMCHQGEYICTLASRSWPLVSARLYRNVCAN